MTARQVISATELPICDRLDEASDLMFGCPLGYIEGKHLDRLRYSASAPLNHAMGDAYPHERYVIFDDQVKPKKGDVVFAYVTLRRRGNEFEEAQIAEANTWPTELTLWERQVIRRFDTNAEGKIILSPEIGHFESWVEGPVGTDFVVEITVAGCATRYTAIFENHPTVYFTLADGISNGASVEAARANAKIFAASSWDGMFTYFRDMETVSPVPETHFGLKVLDRAMWEKERPGVTAHTVAIHAGKTVEVGDIVLAVDDIGKLLLLHVVSGGYTTMQHEAVLTAVTPIGLAWAYSDSFVKKEAA